jgi:chorismate synthase
VRQGPGTNQFAARYPQAGRFDGVLRFLTAGESHGQALVVIVEGLPAGVEVTVEDLANQLARRRLGFGRGPRMRFEQDELTILAGVRHGRTLGSPVAVMIGNSEWSRGKWNAEMSPAPGATEAPLTKVRPGHADLAGMQKYGFDDARDVLERASARETAARVVAGTLARLLLEALGVAIVSHVVSIGDVAVTSGYRPTPDDVESVDASPVRCGDPVAAEAMGDAIRDAARDGDSLGGVAEVLAYGVPVGLGSHVHWDRKLDGLLAQALMSIHAVKAVEIGDGADLATRRGSQAHDAITFDADEGTYQRATDRAGGLEGGITTGGLLAARVSMKPLATLNRPVLATVDTATNEPSVSFRERTDVTAVPALGVVAEAMVALTLANEALRKFGGDSVAEMTRNASSFAEQVASQTVATTTAAGDVELNWDEQLAFADGDDTATPPGGR